MWARPPAAPREETTVRTYQLLIGGRWVDAASGKTFENVNPATGEVLARVAEAEAESFFLQIGELFRRIEACDGQVIA